MVDDGCLDVVPPRTLKRAVSRRHALRDHLHGCHDGRELLAFSQPFADRTIAAVLAEARHHQVPYPTQPDEGRRLTAKCSAESPKLDEGAGDECCLCVVAEAKSVADSRSDGVDVFKCATELDEQTLAQVAKIKIPLRAEKKEKPEPAAIVPSDDGPDFESVDDLDDDDATDDIEVVEEKEEDY